jgi:uncharacterized protein (TIGR03643 family)
MIALTLEDIDRIIEMAWEDRTSFDSIKNQFGISEAEVINMKFSSFLMWRERVTGRATKHKCKSTDVMRFKSSRQKQISHNKISKR